MKEKNEKNEEKKENGSGIVTRETIGAVGAVFSALILFMLCTRSLVFGEIGASVDSFLFGAFGYCAYPLFSGILYLSVASILGKRFVRNRRAATTIVLAFVVLMLIIHAACTCNWNLSGYFSECFEAGKGGIASSTAAGWTGALVVYPLLKLTTKVGAFIVLAALEILFVYLTVCFLKGGQKNAAKAKKAKKAPVAPAQDARQSAPAQSERETQGGRRQTDAGSEPAPSVPPVYGAAYGANGQAPAPDGGQPYAQQPYAQPYNQTPPAYRQPPENGRNYAEAGRNPSAPPYPAPGYGYGQVYPQVRQRPGVTLRNASPAPSESGNAAQPLRDGGASNAFSPFGNPQNMQNVSRNGDLPENREYINSREFLFGAPKESYLQTNLIFDANSNVNRRPSADPNPPTVKDGSFVSSYSAAYENSVNGGDEPSRPAKILTDNVRGDLYAPRGASFADGEKGFGNAGQGPDAPAPSASQDRDLRPAQSYTPPAQPYAPSASQEVPPVQPTNGYPSPFSSAPVFDRGGENGTGTSDRERGDRTGDESVFGREEKKDGETSQNSRPDFFDLFSPSNPNVYGSRELPPEADSGRNDFSERNGAFSDRNTERGAGFDGRETAGRGLFDSDERTDRGDLFGRETESDGRGGARRDLFDDGDEKDSYRLRTDFSDDGKTEKEEDRSERTFSGRDLFDDEEEEEESEKPVPPAPSSPSSPSSLSSRRRAVEPSEPPAPAPQPRPRVHKPYRRVPLDYFDCRDVLPDENEHEVEGNKRTIIETLEAFKVTDATVASVTHGPTVTRYNVVIPRNVSARKVVALDQEIAMNLYADKGVNIYPNFADGAVSIEVPNKNRQFVQLGCMLTGDGFTKSKPTSLVFAMGKDVGNVKVYGDICKMTHLLVAGASGSGKSVFLRSLIISLVVKYSPDELRLILIDPKKTEFVIYDHLPHLMINEIITDINKVIQSLNWAIGEMNRRYTLFEQMTRAGTYVVNIDEYNANLKEGEEKLPKIVIIVDELADLMLAAKKDVEDRIQNLTQKSRAAGIHLIIATQRPSADVITGVIKGNLPTRIAFAVASDVDSRVILDASGAQKLLGKGDLLYSMAGMNAPVRVQGASIESEDAQRVVNFIKANNEAYFDENVSAFINNAKTPSESAVDDAEDEGVEPVYIDALRFIILTGSASISMIQRKCSVGYNKAGKIIEWMEDMGYISAFDGAKARKVLITKEEFEQIYGEL